ncbi:hypothetical protein O2313_04855 [Bacillus amyloliquefaciens]|uniref:hypothetical protein n=1 Tax=Bacillus TaxID=1386 RepID=UPI001957E578|nr:MULTISPECIES: hypothetical protein [Bacillus]MCZ4246859.1 hypothetical protein [Bacillus amyloliquefaciens]
MNNILRVCHIPQLPCKAFKVEVKNLEEALLVSKVLGDYDLFQYNNRIKGDYANVTFVEMFDEELQEWVSWYDEKTGIDDIADFADHLKQKEIV